MSDEKVRDVEALREAIDNYVASWRSGDTSGAIEGYRDTVAGLPGGQEWMGRWGTQQGRAKWRTLGSEVQMTALWDYVTRPYAATSIAAGKTDVEMLAKLVTKYVASWRAGYSTSEIDRYRSDLQAAIGGALWLSGYDTRVDRAVWRTLSEVDQLAMLTACVEGAHENPAPAPARGSTLKIAIPAGWADQFRDAMAQSFAPLVEAVQRMADGVQANGALAQRLIDEAWPPAPADQGLSSEVAAAANALIAYWDRVDALAHRAGEITMCGEWLDQIVVDADGEHYFPNRTLSTPDPEVGTDLFAFFAHNDPASSGRKNQAGRAFLSIVINSTTQFAGDTAKLAAIHALAAMFDAPGGTSDV